MTYPESSWHHHYVTVIDGPRTGFLAGPFTTRQTAEAWIEPAKRAACEITDRAHWYAYGTSRVTTGGEPRIGRLNGRLGITGRDQVPEPERRSYVVSFEIDVDGASPLEAARQAWDNLTAPDSYGPVAYVKATDGTVTTVDLNDDAAETWDDMPIDTPDDVDQAAPEVDEDDLAFDGSNAPPSRDLTARDRDVLCRVLGFVIRDERYRLEDLPRLAEIREVIDPRREAQASDRGGLVAHDFAASAAMFGALEVRRD